MHIQLPLFADMYLDEVNDLHTCIHVLEQKELSHKLKSSFTREKYITIGTENRSNIRMMDERSTHISNFFLVLLLSAQRFFFFMTSSSLKPVNIIASFSYVDACYAETTEFCSRVCVEIK